MVQSILLIIVGFILLIKGADFLVDGASDIAKKFHIPEIIIGLTVVSIGTSMPELFVSTTSAIQGHSDISIGNVIGSNVCNLLLILGLSTVIRPVFFKRETRLIEIPICLVFTIIFFIICNTTGNVITRPKALILLIMFIIFIAYTIYMAKKGEKFDKEKQNVEIKDKKSIKKINTPKSVLYIVLGIIALKFGGDFTVENAIIIARQLNISEKIISLTIIAIGTSLPELITSITAAVKGSSDIAIGNIIGSNIFNMLLIIGISGLINPISYNTTYNIDMGILLLGTVLLAVFPLIPPKDRMNRSNGIIYLLLYVTYLTIMFVVK